MRCMELSRANTRLNLKKKYVNYDYDHPLHHKKQVVMEDVLVRGAGTKVVVTANSGWLDW